MMIYTKEALESARMNIVSTPTEIEKAYVEGWNDALEAVINNLGFEPSDAMSAGIKMEMHLDDFCKNGASCETGEVQHMISAEEARELQRQGAVNALNEEIEEIEDIIRKYAKEGRTNVTIRPISKAARTELERQGYSVSVALSLSSLFGMVEYKIRW